MEASTLGVSAGRVLTPTGPITSPGCLSQYSDQTRLAHTSLQMTYEGANAYLKVVNDYDKQPTWLDRLGLLDL